MNRRITQSFCIALITISAVSSGVFAQDCQEEYIPAIVKQGGVVFDFCYSQFIVEGDYVFTLHSDLVLKVIDFTDKENPQIISQTPIDLDGTLTICGQWLLVLSSEDGIQPIDIKNLHHPVPYAPFLTDRVLFDLAIFQDDIFVTAHYGDILWLDSATLPTPVQRDQKSFSALTGISVYANDSLASGPAGLFYFSPGSISGCYLFNISIDQTGPNPAIVADYILVPTDNFTPMNSWSDLLVGTDHIYSLYTIYWEDSWYYDAVQGMRLVCYNASNLFDAPRVSTDWDGTLQSDDMSFAGNNQLLNGTRVFNLSSSGQWQYFRSFPEFSFFRQQDLDDGGTLFCMKKPTNLSSQILAAAPTDFNQPARMDSHFFPRGNQERIICVDNLVFQNDIIYPENWPAVYWFTAFSIQDNGIFKQLFRKEGKVEWGTTQGIYVNVDTYNESGMIINPNTGDVLWSGPPSRFVDNQCHNESIGCVTSQNELTIFDLSTLPPQVISTWTAEGNIHPPKKLYRDRYYICTVLTQPSHELIVLDLSNPYLPEVVANIPNLNATSGSIDINEDVVSFDGEYFDISQPDNPQPIPEYPYPGSVKSGISIVRQDGRASIFRVLSTEESQFFGEINLDYAYTKWDVVDNFLISYSSNELISFLLPCEPNVATALQYFRLVDDGSKLTWQFTEDVSSSDLRLVFECNSIHQDLPFNQNLNGFGYSEVATFNSCQSTGPAKFHLMLRQGDSTWGVVATVEQQLDSVSSPFIISSIAPNPSNPSTTMVYRLAGSMKIKVSVYDLAGWLVRLLSQETVPAGTHQVQWNGKDSTGKDSPSGAYFFRIEGEGFVRSEKITLLR